MITTDVEDFVVALKSSLSLERKQTIPVLGYVRVTGDSITATDLDCTTIVGFKGKGKIDALIPYRQALDVLAGESGSMTLGVKEGKKNVKGGVDSPGAVIKVNGCEYSFTTMVTGNFPQAPKPANPTLTIDAKNFKTMIGRTIFAISSEQSRYTLNGALLQAKNGDVSMVATDGHRLARVIGVGEGDLKPTIVPRLALEWLQKNVSGVVSIGVDEHNQTFVTENKTLVARIMNGQYPNYQAVIPKDTKIVASFESSKDLLGTVTRVAKCADTRSLAMKWSFEFKKLKVFADSIERGSASAELDCVLDPVIDGPGCRIGFCATYIQEFLRAIEDQPFTMGIKDEQSAAIFKIENFEYVVMPMRI